MTSNSSSISFFIKPDFRLFVFLPKSKRSLKNKRRPWKVCSSFNSNFFPILSLNSDFIHVISMFCTLAGPMLRLGYEYLSKHVLITSLLSGSGVAFMKTTNV